MKKLKPYYEMTKPRIVFMVLITTTTGFLLAERENPSWLLLAITLLGTALAASGAAVLNNYLERDLDARMNRTKKRALPSGRIEPAAALCFGVILAISGVAILAGLVNLLTGFIVLLTLFLYVVVYTPLKRVTWLNTPIGAIPGALPPMSGWTASSGELELGAWVLFFILFAWQHPHFYAIAWMYQDDYEKAGYKMLPSADPTGNKLCVQIILYSVALCVIALIPTLFLHLTGVLFLAGASILGAGMLTAGLAMADTKSRKDARMLLLASVIYLPALLVLIIADGII